jgi:hypothetical protein
MWDTQEEGIGKAADSRISPYINLLNFIPNLSNFYFTSASVQGMSSRNNNIL